MVELTEAEVAVYDRQLRVWGIETQKRLTSSSILIIGCTGLAAEVAKNIVLAGVGSVILVDDTPVSSRAPGNFLVHLDADPSRTVAEASVSVLQEMNPLVKVSSLAGSSTSLLTPNTVKNYTVVLLIGQPAHIIQQADKVCSEANVAFYAANSRGFSGWAFANLHEHQYRVETKKEEANGATKKVVTNHTLSFVSWDQAITAQQSVKNLKRASPLYPILRVCMPLELEKQRSLTAADVPALQQAWVKMCQEEGLDETFLPKQSLEAFATMPDEMAAVNAVLGGVVANDLLKAASGNGQPVIDNMFMFSLVDGAGWVERLDK